MSLRSLWLLSMISLVLRILPCIPRCCHLLHAGSCRSIWKTLRTSPQVSISHPRHHYSLLPFLLGYFFIAGRLCINDVTQQCHLTRVSLRPLSFFESITILVFILDYFLCPRWYSSLEVDLPFSLFCYGVFDLRSFKFLFMYDYWSESSYFFFGTSLILLFL